MVENKLAKLPQGFSRRDFLRMSAALPFLLTSFSRSERQQTKESVTRLPFNPGLHFLAIGDRPDHIEHMMGGRDAQGTFDLVKKLGHIPVICDVTNRDSNEAQLQNFADLLHGVKPDYSWLRIDLAGQAGKTLPQNEQELKEYLKVVVNTLAVLGTKGVAPQLIILGNEADLTDDGKGGVMFTQPDYEMIVQTVNAVSATLLRTGGLVALPAFSAGIVPDGGDPAQIFEDYNILHLGNLLDEFDKAGGLPPNVVPSFHSYLRIQTQRVPAIFSHPRIALRIAGRTPVGTEVGAHEWDWGKSYQNQHYDYYDILKAMGIPYVMWNAFVPEAQQGDAVHYSLLNNPAGIQTLTDIFHQHTAA